MRVAAIVPVYNQGAFVEEALSSVLAQKPPPAEIIVVDDGSTDDTSSRLSSFRDRTLVVRQENGGVAAARNRGVALSKGDLVAFLDADDTWLPGKLQAQLALFEADPALGLVHCGVEEVDAEGQRLRLRLDGQDGWVADRMLSFGTGVILGGGSAAVIRRDLFQEVGGFDERLSTSADWDLHQRVARVARVGFVPEPLVRYRRHGGNMHRNVAAMEHDMLLAFAKAFARPDAPRSLRRAAYSGLHYMLAGSYLEAGQRTHVLRHLARALRMKPLLLLRVFARAMRRVPAA